MSSGFSLFEDIFSLINLMKTHPTSFSWLRLLRTKFGENIPPLVGTLLMGSPTITITTAGHLQDIYVHKN